MLRAISRFCSGHPRLVIGIVVLITAISGLQIYQKSYFEADLTKFIPKDIPAVKSDDYYKKNFNYQDNMIIGIERAGGSVMEPEVLSRIEAITYELKNLKGTKTINSKLKGAKVQVTLPVGIDPDSVRSIANAEDAILDKEGARPTGRRDK